MERPRHPQFRKLKSAPPQRPLSSAISSLVKGTDLVGIVPQAIIELADTLQKDIRMGYTQLLAVDRAIGGVGLHNVNKPEGEWLTGTYRLEFRPLFRPIQYVFMWITDGDLVWNARRVVQDSCLHVEYAVKFRFAIPTEENASLGILLSRASVEKALDRPFGRLLRRLNRVVYRTAKHTIEDIIIDAHRFTPADALAVYLVCRWAGVKLLEPTGLFNDWKSPD